MFFSPEKNLLFSEMFFLSAEINWVFFLNRQQFNARWAEKNIVFL